MKFNRYLGLIGIAEGAFLISLFVIGVFAFKPMLAHADSLEVVPATIGDIQDVEGQSTVVASDFEIRMNASCYGTNLRSVSSPLRPNATVTMNVKLKKTDTTFTNVVATFPASLTQRGGVGGGLSVSSPGSAQIVGAGNTAIIKLPVGEVKGVTIDGAGNYDANELRDVVDSIRFTQAAADSGTVVGTNGPISANVTRRLSQDGRVLFLTARFPGAEGFCGGFYSPLMVFVTDDRPQFTGKSRFPILANRAEVYWPEQGAAGYFLAVDENKNGKIDTKDELFTNSTRWKNGFEALKLHDSNKDNVIDAKDKNFAKMVLWNDENGNGVSEKAEMVPASKMIVSISLDYRSDKYKPIGERAEARERSKVTVRGPAGKRVRGDIIDYWFAPTGK